MACCKAEEYHWCGKEPVVDYKDEEGKEYCVFHAPKGKKGIPFKEFNELVYKRIEEAKKNNWECDLSGTIFEWDIYFFPFGNNNPLPNISFDEAEFCNFAFFSGTIFKKNVRFFNTTFKGEVVFSGGIFEGDALFAYATFKGAANFHGTTFNARADFLNATFKLEDGVVDFNGATFKREAIFREATFNGLSEFKRATFNGSTDFFDATFKVADFQLANFVNMVYFSFAKFKERAIFNFTIINGQIFFKGAPSRKDSKEAASQKVFCKGADFKHAQIKGVLIFEDCNLSEVSFLDTDLRKADFINPTWARKKGSKEVLYDELQLDELDEKSDTGVITPIEKVEILYRRLKQKYTDEHDWPEVSNWHFGEKEMARRRANKGTWMLLNLYRFSCGYGERPRRAAGVFVGLIFVFAIATALAGLEPATNAPKWVGGLQGFWKPPAYFLNTLQSVTFLKTPYFEPSNLISAGIKFLSQVLVPVQAAFLVLALRNRFRR